MRGVHGDSGGMEVVASPPASSFFVYFLEQNTNYGMSIVGGIPNVKYTRKRLYVPRRINKKG